MRSVRVPVVFGLCLCFSASSAISAAQTQPSGGFTFGGLGGLLPFGKHVTLRRALPPVFNASGHTVSVLAEPGVNPTVATQLQSEVEGFLTNTNSNVQVQREHAEVVIHCKPSAFTAPHTVSTNTNGTQTNTLDGSLEVQFQIVLVSSGRVLASNRYTADAAQELSQTVQGSPAKTRKVLGMSMQSGGPVTTNHSSETPEQMESNLTNEAARAIASYLVSTPQEVEVPLAGGRSLNEANKLAEAGLWSRDLETLESMSPDPNAHTDALRVYDMGVANEALGYATQDLPAAMKYLSEASNDYGKSMDAIPDNKQFIAAQNRIKAALAQTTARLTIAKSAPEPAGNSAAARSVPVSAESAEAPLTDEDVVQMVSAHLDEANILDTIQHAGRVRFDLSVPAQVKMSHAGVSGKVLMAMKTRARSAGGAQ